MKTHNNSTIRLNKYLANVGIASRRNVATVLEENIVTVNGSRVIKPGIRIDSTKDEVLLNGKKIKPQQSFVYIMLNKPKGVISTAHDDQDRQTVVDLVRSKVRLYPVGRLDQDTSGLILLTNDGELANKLTHPRFHIAKTYELTVIGRLTPIQLKKIQTGVKLKDGLTSPAEITVVEENENKHVLRITIYEGRNRQVRRMCSATGLNLVNLKRIAIGEVGLGDLPTGGYRALAEDEILSLKKT